MGSALTSSSRHPRRQALFAALIGVVIGACWFVADYAHTPVLVLGPMVQQVTQDGFALFWRVHPEQPSQVSLRSSGTTQPAGDPLVSPQSAGGNIATFSGLLPGHTYDYEISCRGRTLAGHTVRTAPAHARGFRFLAFGDSGTGGWWQNRLADGMAGWRPDLILHTGDLIYPHGRIEDNHRKFFQPYAGLLAEIPVYVSLGNHEYKLPGADPPDQPFVFPPNGPKGQPPEHHFWFDYAGARFVAIDSNNDEAFFREVVAPWLDEVLGSAGERWKIVFFHEPVYTHGKYPPAAKLLNTIVPVMDRRGVELVLCGHNHMYERTRPLRGGGIVPDGQGTVYITTGAGGANLAEARLPMPETIAAWNDRQHSFTVADVAADRIVLRQMGVWGGLLDECHVLRNGNAQPAASARLTR